jgi:predicted pyridoxine 5'-phosphate oxidase superfamily flavin-nucleotide-binding protein
MSDTTYHAGMRELQDRFDSRRLADRLDERLGRSVFRDEDRAFIESRRLFFLASADAEGRPDCSYKGGAPGFVRVVSGDELEFPSYDGNGQFRSLGNVLANPAVGLLFIDFESPRRLRVNGRAALLCDAEALARHRGAQLVVRVRAVRIFPNCPRYIHRGGELSADVPRPGHEPPAAAWKAMPWAADVLPQPPGRAGLTR